MVQKRTFILSNIWVECVSEVKNVAPQGRSAAFLKLIYLFFVLFLEIRNFLSDLGNDVFWKFLNRKMFRFEPEKKNLSGK